MGERPDSVPRFGQGSRPRKFPCDMAPSEMAQAVLLASRLAANPRLIDALRYIAKWIESHESAGAALANLRWGSRRQGTVAARAREAGQRDPGATMSRARPMPKTPLPCGCVPDFLPYVSAHLDAERRLKRGERQTFCPGCKRWRWKHEMRAERPNAQ